MFPGDKWIWLVFFCQRILGKGARYFSRDALETILRRSVLVFLFFFGHHALWVWELPGVKGQDWMRGGKPAGFLVLYSST